MAKQARKVALINVHDYPRSEYSAQWQITVTGTDEEGYHWRAKLISYEPIGYLWEGKVHKEWPEGVAKPVYPAEVPVKQAEYEKMSAENKAKVQKLQDEWRAKCAAVYEASPKAVYEIDEAIDACATRDEADTAAQQWVLARIGQYKRPANKEAGFALAITPVGMALDALFELGKRLFGPLLAIAYSQTVRHNRLHQVRDAIDGGAGAGLLRIYDGSRPATCGTATTLGAELTFSDPCAGSASGGALTMSSITADASANASITASWFRCVDSTGTCVIDGNVGTSGSDLNLNSTTISSGVNVAVSSFVITGGNA